MSVLPNYTGNNAELLFRIIDERISELYSIHGKASFRDALNLKNIEKNETTVPGKSYSDSLLFAWAKTAPNGNIRVGYNLKCEKIATGRYQYTLINKPDELSAGSELNSLYFPFIDHSDQNVILTLQDGIQFLNQNGVEHVIDVFTPQIAIVPVNSDTNNGRTSFWVETLYVRGVPPEAVTPLWRRADQGHGVIVLASSRLYNPR